MRNLLLFLCFMISGYFGVYAAPNYAGVWRGYITQESSMALAANYHFMVELEMDGHLISGRSEIRLWDDSQIYAEMNLIGEYNDIQLSLNETAITKQQIYTFAYWCLKKLTLTYLQENGHEYLKGNWSSNSCSGPGEVFLERAPSV